jgi:magnesium transporter
MHSLLVCQNGHFGTGAAPSAIKDALAQPDAIIWLDIADPNAEDVALLRDQFEFHPLAIEDAVRSHERPKVDAYGRYYFIIFYAAHYNTQTMEIELQPLHLFIGPNYLVSVHPGPLQYIADAVTRWQLPNTPLSNKVSAILYALLDGVVDAYFPLMDQIADRIEILEDTIFQHFDESAIQTIFGLKTDLLRLRHVVAPERDVLNVLLRRELPVFRPEDIVYLQDIYDHIVRVTDNIDTYRDLLSSALDSYLSLQSNNLNQVMKLLTMASIVLMSNALVAGVYGMNFQFMPELKFRWGYPAILLVMAGVAVYMIEYFRKKKWF